MISSTPMHAIDAISVGKGVCRGFAALVLAFAGLAQAQSAPASPPSNLAVTVLPLANSNAADDAFADGLSDELGGVLAKIPELHVSGRASAFRFKAQPQDVHAVADALKVSHAVEGSVVRIGSRIRLSLKLVGTDGAQLWTKDYDGAFANIFEMEEDAAKSIAASLHVAESREPLIKSRTSDMEAYEAYLRAKPLIRARGQKPFADAAELLQKAVARDPDFAPASALLAFDYDLAPLYQLSIRNSQVAEAKQFVNSVIPKAESLAQH
ncbi:MAG TPA: hypothetical protein VEU06_00630, partial [Micropepsaceae bacterium]|nr:hypothetical protein [Micropepsaceae bacterium]